MGRRIVESSRTGEQFVFDDTWNEPDGRVRQMEYVLQPNSKVGDHRHPATSQSFEVLAGTLHVRVNGGEVLVLNSGDTATTGVDGVHTQWNEGPDATTVIESYDPPLDIEPFFTIMADAMASRNLLKMAVFFSDFRSISTLESRPLRLIVTVLAPLGRLVGLRRWYASLDPGSARRPTNGTN
jgi:quercetin dioxygenase-like cupin family protein